MSGYVAVIGGANVDIGGRSFAPLVAADSNPGMVTVSLGGVGRNIAHNLRLLGMEVSLVTAYGDDPHGALMEASCAALGLDLSHALRVPGGTTSTYLYIADETGEMQLAVADMGICRRLIPASLEAQLPWLNGAEAVVIDANLEPETLAWIGSHVTAPLFADPVSTAKAERLRPLLGAIHTLKPNRLEAGLLTGLPVRSAAEAVEAGRALLSKGVQRVFISLGAEGLVAVTRALEAVVPNPPCTPVNTTGCGDALMAALVWSHCRGDGLTASCRAGLAASAIAMESKETINPALSEEALRRKLEAM